MKKLLCSLLAVVTFAATAITPAFAESNDAGNGHPTMCFDKELPTPYFMYINDDDKTVFSDSISDSLAQKGYSLEVKGNITASEDEATRGFAFPSSFFELNNYENCTVTFSYYIPKEYLDYSDSFLVYSDGVIWIEYNVPVTETDSWQTYSITIPKTATNNRIGIAFTGTKAYDGTLIYLDNLTVTDADGNAVANIGDYSDVEITSKYADLKTDGIVITIIQFVIIAALIFIFVVLLVKILRKRKERFR